MKAFFTKNRTLMIMLAVETLFIIYGISCFFKSRVSLDFSYSQMSLMQGEFSSEHEGAYTDSDDEPGFIADYFTYGPTFDLPKGSYDVTLYYETDTDNNHCEILNMDYRGYDSMKADTVTLYAINTEETFTVYLNEDLRNMQVVTNYYHEGYLIVRGLSVHQTYAAERILLTVILFVSLLVNFLYLYFRKHRNDVSVRKTAFALVVISLAASLPLMMDYLIYSSDLDFHLMRIEGLADGIRSGQFPVKVNPTWLNGYGYATSVFYGDLFLYIPAIMRIIGFTVMTSYKTYAIMINFATCFIAYYCFSRMFKNKHTGLVGSMLYTLAPYRFTNLYVRIAVGEYTAMAFLPLIVYGLYRIYTEDDRSPDYKYSILPAVLGFSGIIQSHALTCEMVGLFTILLCVIMIKKTLKPRRFLALAMVVICTVILNAGFLVPFLHYMSGNYKITTGAQYNQIQTKGAFIPQLFAMFTTSSDNPLDASLGLQSDQSAALGIALIIGVLIFIYMVITKEIQKNAYFKTGIIVTLLGILAAYMATMEFPWDYLQSHFALVKNLISSLQFPYRFLSIATVLLVTSGCVAVNHLLTAKSACCNYRKEIITSMIVVAFISGFYMMNTIMNDNKGLVVYDTAGLNTRDTAGNEYLPQYADPGQFVFSTPQTPEGIHVSSYNKKYNTITVTCENTTSEDSYMQLPLIAYNGFTATDTASGTAITIEPYDIMQLVIPAGYSGTIEVKFTGFWFWKASAILSIIAVLALIGIEIRRWRKSSVL